ncbi:MAG TPA: hypothetical protein VMF52_20560 [Steroidobacteraceae bacterium]|nr:hypothetical protein [Steroidobacteraceae bacterium]
MNRQLLVFIAIAAGLLVPAYAATAPKYPAFELKLEDATGERFLFSAGDASITSPIFVDIAGRDPTVADKKYRMRVEKRWVAAHLPEGAEFAYYGSAECKVKPRKMEFPGCEIIAFVIPATGEKIAYFFYVGHWPFE